MKRTAQLIAFALCWRRSPTSHTAFGAQTQLTCLLMERHRVLPMTRLIGLLGGFSRGRE